MAISIGPTAIALTYWEIKYENLMKNQIEKKNFLMS